MKYRRGDDEYIINQTFLLRCQMVGSNFVYCNAQQMYDSKFSFS